MKTLPEFMTSRQAMAALAIKSHRTMAKLRRRCPDIAVMLPGMQGIRYVQSRILALVEERMKNG